MKRTVLRSSGTVVPPDVTHAMRREAARCVAMKRSSRDMIASAKDAHARARRVRACAAPLESEP